MLVITGTIKIDTEEELIRVREALIRRATRSRKDEGNIDYVFTQNLEDPKEIRLIEKWESEAALNAHLQLPDEEFDKVMQTAKIKAITVISNETINERVLLQR